MGGVCFNFVNTLQLSTGSKWFWPRVHPRHLFQLQLLTPLLTLAIAPVLCQSLNTSGSHTLGWEICSGLFPQMSAWPTLFSSQPLVMLLSDETCPDYPVLNVSLPPCYTCTLSFPVICTRFFHSIYFLTHYVLYLFTVSGVCVTLLEYIFHRVFFFS